MQIKPFIEAATKANAHITTQQGDGYSISMQLPHGVVQCTTQRKKVRVWKNLEVLAQGLKDKGFSGQLRVEITQQGSLHV